eukprot:GHUV01045768.1.p1 GENE.GHUV01045768.1~~GHUV01045768.1.p1  ORF type:complete len:260 (+),score=56.76 GHUV01045768.1:502-1281(+)
MGCGKQVTLSSMQEEHGDMLFVDVADGYHNLWRKALRSLELLQRQCKFAYYMHADDDSYVRLDMILELLAGSPREKFYWGYIWDGTGNRVTAPIRKPSNKSHMPVEQYALDYYPPFASGCGFILSIDLVQALLKQPLPDYRLLDPPFGIHLCGKEFSVLPDGPIKPVHDDRVRPYRGIPIFQATTVVQHYLTAEEMMPYHKQVIAALQKGLHQPPSETAQALLGLMPGSVADATGLTTSNGAAAERLYAQLVQLGLLRR